MFFPPCEDRGEHRLPGVPQNADRYKIVADKLFAYLGSMSTCHVKRICLAPRHGFYGLEKEFYTNIAPPRVYEYE